MTMADYDYTEIDTAINSSDYITASDFLDKNQNRYYYKELKKIKNNLKE